MNTPTDDFTARLRSAVQLDELHSQLDPEQVLISTLRSQRRHRLLASAAATCVLVAGLAVWGPLMADRGSEQPPPAAAVLPEDTLVEIDTTTGTITLPWDRYWLTESEQADVSRASALAMRECAAERGYDIPETTSAGTSIAGDRRYGIWWLPTVEQFGYDYPRTPQQQIAVDAEATTVGPTDEQMAILEECNATPTLRALWPNPRLSEVVPDFAQAARETTEGQAVFEDWADCLETHGLKRNEALSPWAVTDDSGEQSPGTASAITDAQCKADVDFIARLAQIEAKLQAPYIAQHRDELTAVRAALEESVALARNYIADHG